MPLSGISNWLPLALHPCCRGLSESINLNSHKEHTAVVHKASNVMEGISGQSRKIHTTAQVK